MKPVFSNSLMADYVSHASLRTEEQIITGYGYPIDGAIGSSGGGRVRKLLVVCLHNKAIIARGILVTILHCGTPEARFSAIYIVNSVGTSLSCNGQHNMFQSKNIGDEISF